MKQLQHTHSVIGRCYGQLKNLTGGELRLFFVWSDVYYLPSHVIPEISAVMSLFRKHEVYVDLAVPTAIYCITNLGDIEPMQKLAVWGPDRTNGRKLPQFFKSFQSRHDHILHPTKWGLLAENRATGYAQFFCTQVVPFVHHGL